VSTGIGELAALQIAVAKARRTPADRRWKD
jgi:hypothetical protein